jgi:uncharacterized cupin superfamily protein
MSDGTNDDDSGGAHTAGQANIVSSADVDPDRHDHGQRTFRQYRLAHAAGGQALGTSLYEFDPGRRTWPAHYHTANEEAIYVLDGELTLWVGPLEDPAERRLDPGDYVALPTGPDHAHEVEATGGDTARFLLFSTMRDPDFTVLDGSSDVERMAHLVAGDAPGEYEGRYVSRTVDFDAEVPYWEVSDDGSNEGTDNGTDDESNAGDSDEQDRTATVSVADHVVAEADLDWDEYDPPRAGHRFRRKQLGAAAGGERLGTSLYEVPPGRRTWLPHYHTGNEEAIYVLAGEGTATLGVDRDEYALSSGDYVALPAGEAGYHDVVAGDETLRYLLVSTMEEPDVTVYPDDGKVGLYAGSAPGGDPDERTLSTYLDANAAVEYWD